MRWTKLEEKEILKEWASQETNETIRESVLAPINKAATYWGQFDNTQNIQDYDFSTIPEISELLKTELGEQCFRDIILPVSIGIIKGNVTGRQNLDKESENEDDFRIPEFVYVF